ncbi:MAG: polysaccharide biosynthesis C-terminal domain-containing protein, partial [Saprospiraceae bacterium]|nr:polysaccharide biosynthesis C-terminal domain-containing protein [Saprospiraceae bacterium]
VAWLECFVASTGVVLISMGKTGTLRNLGIFSSSTFVGSFVLGLPFGIVGIATMYFFANLIVVYVVFAVVLKALCLGMRDLARGIWRPVAISLVMAAFITFADSSMVEFLAWQRLLILAPTGAILYVALIFLLARDLFELMLRMLWKIKSSQPRETV